MMYPSGATWLLRATEVWFPALQTTYGIIGRGSGAISSQGGLRKKIKWDF